jgi:hypothetical protein
MLENGTDENVVRWGDQGDSFVVLEVCNSPSFTNFASSSSKKVSNCVPFTDLSIYCLEREVHKTHPAETLQTQQFCKFCTTTQQVRLS